MKTSPFTAVVRDLTFTVPFVGPSEIERRRGHPFALRLGANENLFGVSQEVTQALHRTLPTIGYYPDPKNHDLIQALADFYRIDDTNLLIANGVDELLGLMVRAFCETGDVAVTSAGTYPTFSFHVKGYGARLVSVPYAGTQPDLDALAEAAHKHNAKLVYLANPDNPSGTFHSRESIRKLRSSLPDSTMLLLDEAYVEFAPPEEDVIEPFSPNLIQLRSFSKAYGLAGLRIGYAMGDAQTIRTFEKIRLHFGVSIVAQTIAVAALKDRQFVESVIDETRIGRVEYDELSKVLGLSTIPSATNFVLFDMGSSETALQMIQLMEERGVFVRYPGNSCERLSTCIRVTVGTAEQRAAFAEQFRALLPLLSSS